MCCSSFLQAVNKTNGLEAALKQIPVDEISDISDHMVEIEILMECRHTNVIGLLETFYYDNKLSVRIFVHFCVYFVKEYELKVIHCSKQCKPPNSWR